MNSPSEMPTPDLTYSNWATNEPNGCGMVSKSCPQHFIAIEKGGSWTDGEWNDVEYYDQKQVICQRSDGNAKDINDKGRIYIMSIHVHRIGIPRCDDDPAGTFRW